MTNQAMVKTVSCLVKIKVIAVCSDKFPSILKRSAESLAVDAMIIEL